MSKAASKNSKLFIVVDSTNNELVNVRNWSLNTTRNTIDVSTIGTEWREFLVGQVTATGSCNLIYDSNDNIAQTVMASIRSGESLNFEIRPLGNSNGSPKINFTALVTSSDISAATEDAITVALSFQVTGEMTEGTISA